MTEKKTTSSDAFTDFFDYNDDTLRTEAFLDRLDDVFRQYEYWSSPCFKSGSDPKGEASAKRDRKASHSDVFKYNGRRYKYTLEVYRNRWGSFTRTNQFTVDGGGDVSDWRSVYDEVLTAHPELYTRREWKVSNPNPGKILWDTSFETVNSDKATREAAAMYGVMFHDTISDKPINPQTQPLTVDEYRIEYADFLTSSASYSFVEGLKKAGIAMKLRNVCFLDISDMGNVSDDEFSALLRSCAIDSVSKTKPQINQWIANRYRFYFDTVIEEDPTEISPSL